MGNIYDARLQEGICGIAGHNQSDKKDTAGEISHNFDKMTGRDSEI